MFNKPQFKPHFQIEVVEPDTVYLLGEQDSFALSGQFYTQLAPFLKGQHTLEEIIKHFQNVSPLKLYHVLTRLEEQGYLAEGEHHLSRPEAAFWSTLGNDARVAASQLQKSQVSVHSLGQVDSQSFVTALQSLNIQVTETEAEFNVVLTDDYLQAGLEEFNQKALQAGKPWLLVKPVGTVIWLGPIFIPHQTGCWECLAQRLRGNREIEAAVSDQKGEAVLPTSQAALPTSLQMGIHWAATETAKWLAQTPTQPFKGNLFTFDWQSMQMQQHVLVKRPQCQVCGEAEPAKPKPIVLQSRKKRFTADGGHRSLPPEQILKKYDYHLSPITGVVSNLLKLDQKSEFIHVCGAIHALGRKSDNLARLRLSLGSKSAGKGKTDIQSRASGFCEAIERYSGVFTGDEYRIKATYAQVEPQAIYPHSLLLYSQAQYRNRQAWNSQHGSFAWVAQPFDESQEIDWTPVWSLNHQTFKYLPTAYCYYGYPLSKTEFCQQDSNGNAAGNTIEEAILQGLMELVERDAVALWWYNRIQRTAVDLESFDEPYLQELKAYYQTQHRDLWVLDITSDLNIPTFAAISCRTDKPQAEIFLGFGTHIDPTIGILRAVTELNQMWTLLARHQEQATDDPDIQYWFDNATLENQPYLIPLANTFTKEASDYSCSWSDDLQQDILRCVKLLEQKGMETLVLDQTRPDVGLSVVKVIVPGLRHFWPRFAPGRLYDVPVQMSWLEVPLQEAQLNPIPMFF